MACLGLSYYGEIMKRVLITGGTGFVGASLARRMLADGHEVHLIIRAAGTAWRIKTIREDVRLHENNLSDNKSLARLIATIRPDWVFHLAVYGAYSDQNDLRLMLRTNVTGTANLVDVCVERGFEAFVNAGSSSEYGFKNSPPSEEDRIDPNSQYAVTKSFATQYCAFAARKHNMKVVTLRLYSVYGPYEDKRRFIPTLISHAIKGRLPPLVAPETARDFVYVDDICEAFVLAATKSVSGRGLVYNIGSGIQTTIRQAVDIAIDMFGIKEDPLWNTMPGRQWDTDKWVADSHLARTCLNWHPQYSFRDGFQKTMEWTMAHPGLI